MTPVKLHHGLASDLKQANRFASTYNRRLAIACNRFRVGEATSTDREIMVEAAKRLLGIEAE